MVMLLARIGRTLIGTIGGRTLIGLIVLIVGYQVWLTASAGGKIADGVTDEPDRRGQYSIDVELGFPPERFHILEMQSYGRIRGTTENVIHLNGVMEDEIDAIARKYWVEEIRPGEDSVSLSDILGGD
ncbi:hypothetical protein [Phytoactinopolyspora halotolerans]|uniref:Uncharacterized protein n=1 Tax=Phytoactinopolyspora halotolerans TaxID=1981512 RepID=A0A6L9SCX3_9ACTN|nr:hypothetical protein [Phytoactinopolyspora halotolerans]NEE02927.1 hypothetical protein [Phytoactinopolyspora halotolerans]